MAHYLIFIPDVAGSNPDHLKTVGLGDLLRADDSGPEGVFVDRGPNGRSGMVFSWRKNNDRDPRIGMYPEFDWIPSLEMGDDQKAGRFYLGIDRERKPEPADLSRSVVIVGHRVSMADGFAYTVPTISKLPHKFTVKNGEVTRQVKEQYQQFYDLGMSLAKGILEQFAMIDMLQDAKAAELENYAIPVSVADGLKMISIAIGLNYRINFEIAMLLGLFDESSAMLAFLKFCELDQIRAATDQKKTLDPILIPVGSNSFGGVAG